MENQRVLAAKQFIKNQAKKASDYFKPTEKVRTRDFIREVPGAVAQTFSGTRDTVVKGGKILGEGLAYATSKNVRDQYKAGNTNILPTISNTTPRQMLANTAKSAFEIAPVGKIKGLATAAMSAKLLPRVLAGGAMGYGYDVADKMSRPEPISQSTFHPGIATLAGALMGGMSRPTSEMLGQAGKEIANDVRTINPANRLSHKIVDKYDYEPVPGVFAPGGIQQQRPIMESFRKEVETTQLPYSPQSSIARFLMGKQKVGMGIEPQNPLLQEAGKYKSAEEFVKSQSLYHGTPNELEGGVLKFGAGKQLKKGGYMGGHFLTDTPEIADNFRFGGKVYQASGEIKNKVLDVNKNKKLFEDYIGKEYVSDGEKIKFTKQDFDYMFPEGKADWSTINTDLLEQLAKKQGKIGVAIPEYAGGKQGMTYQIFEDNIPVKTKEQLIEIYEKSKSKVSDSVGSLPANLSNRKLGTTPKSGASKTKGAIAEKIARLEDDLQNIDLEIYNAREGEYTGDLVDSYNATKSQLTDLYNKAQGNNKK